MLNVVLLVVDSLRARSLNHPTEAVPTPFLNQLSEHSLDFRRAYAADCWTLPSHCSMFTGLLPSEHGAHFQSMAYRGQAPTAAEILSKAGYHTELITRNFVFDGTIPGITRGFQKNTRPIADQPVFDPFGLIVALAKPRFRRHLKDTGFFHPYQSENCRFLTDFARTLSPADDLALDRLLEAMTERRKEGRPYFFFCNLYDVHAPYPPTAGSNIRPLRRPSDLIENLSLPFVLSKLGTHSYLKPDFKIAERSRKMLLGRYHSAIELMDQKLEQFYNAAKQSGLLDDTLFILTSDHGEAFGDHGLYLHDASLYDEHLHVPLWIHHPNLSARYVDEIVSTRDLFHLICSAARPDASRDTILDPLYRAAHPIALAEHFHYPHLAEAAPRYKQNIAAAITDAGKVIVHRDGVARYDLQHDPEERTPEPSCLTDFEGDCRNAGLASDAITFSLDHLKAWRSEN